MTAPRPLFVPVQLDALVVNDQVRRGENFQRWQANFALARLRLSPEPPPFGNIDTDFAIDPERNGVYLQWQLPQALTGGTQDHPDADLSFPLVPNRWLVVRTHGAPDATAREQSAWLVESDHLDPVTGTSPYALPDGTITRIGRRIDLATGEWTEPGPPEGDLFLTAVGPGVPTFAVYQPYNEDVFSIHDTMAGLDPTRAWTVGYLVVGWYSDPAADPVTRVGSELRTLLADFEWAVTDADPEDADAPVEPASRGVFHGTVLGVNWHGTGPLPESPRPDLVAVALGHNSAHASSVFQAEAEPPDAPGLAELLNLCQRGLLDAVDEPDGAFTKARATFASWFVPTPAGYHWTLETDPDAPEEPDRVRRAARRAHTGLLARFNADQAVHDELARDLAAAQRRMYDLWWTEGLPMFPEFGTDGEPLEPGSYHADLSDGLRVAEAEVQRLDRLLTEARSRIPWGRTQQELQDSIADHTGRRTPGFVFKREVLPDLHRATEPVVALRRTEEDQQARLAAEEGLRCRRPDELVRGVYLDAERTVLVAAPASAVPVPPNLPAEPDGLRLLLAEFFHLDPANAPALAEAAERPASDVPALRTAMADPARHAYGLVPGHGTTAWQQPWSPLFFQWEVDYYPITYAESAGIEDPEHANWEFDGNRYRWKGDGADHEPLTLRGRQFLTPTPAQTMADSLRHAAADRAGPYAELLRDLARRADEADLVSQTLDGFNDQLLARSANEAVYLGGGSRVRQAAIGEQIAQGLPPDPGPLPRPFTGWAASRFQEVRSGQFAFTRLHVVDRFGRGLPVVIPDEIELRDTIGQGTPAHAFKPGLPDDLSPGAGADGELVTVVDRDPERFVEVKPRLPQPARTRLDLLSAVDDTHVPDEEDAAASICAWLVPNHLDQALLCYAADGAPLGSVAASVMPDGTTVPRWQPLPGSAHTGPDTLAEAHEHLHALVTDLLALDRTTLRTFLRGIDRALTTIAPTGDQDPPTTIGRLLGRPLALVRARVRLDLDGPAYRDPSWQHLRNPRDPQYPLYRWPVRLGERDELGDGLVGYYKERDYTGLHIVLAETDIEDLEDTHDYLRPIGPGNGLAVPARPPRDHDATSTAHVTLLLDPYGAVHATTGILPTERLRVPARAFEESLGAIAAGFRFGPFFTVEAPDDAALVLPRPADRHGTWTWAEPAPAGAWTTHATLAADARPALPFARPVLRTGYLQVAPPEEGPTP